MYSMAKNSPHISQILNFKYTKSDNKYNSFITKKERKKESLFG